MKSFFILVTFFAAASLAGAQFFSSYKFKFYYSGWEFRSIFDLEFERFWFIFSGVQDYTQFNLMTILKHEKFNATKPTVLYFYGTFHSPMTDTVILMKNAYVNSGHNFILFDINTLDYTYLVIFLEI